MYAIRRGLGVLNCPGDFGCPGNMESPPLAVTPGMVWTDCPDGSTVPANVGCPSYGQTVSDFIGANPGTVMAVAGGLVAFILFAKAGR